MKLQSFREFWPHYLRAHSDPRCRAMHYIGSSAGIAALVAVVFGGSPWLIAAGLVTGYGCAWIGHFFIEENVPLTFRYPLWSFAADYLMLGKALTGRLGQDLRAARA